jgi:hypothetical protein
MNRNAVTIRRTLSTRGDHTWKKLWSIFPPVY